MLLTMATVVFLHKFGQKGSGQGQLDFHMAVIVDSNNRLIISDRPGTHEAISLATIAAVCLKLSLESRAVLNFGRHVASDKCRQKHTRTH